MASVLVLCTGNSCRSQMAEGYLRFFAPPSTLVYSAGIEQHGVNPRAVATMAADGIDISSQTSNAIAEFEQEGMTFDYVITVCDNAKENCPYFPATVRTFHHNFPDPAKAVGSEAAIMEQFAAVRDAIKSYCQAFVAEHLA